MRLVTLCLLTIVSLVATQTTAEEEYCDETTTTTTTTTKAITTTTKPTTTTTKKVPTTTIVGWECQSGWNYFSRQLGKWCMLVHSGTVTREAARLSCEAANGTLSGIENSNEQAWVISKATAIIRALPGGDYRQGAFWVGAQRVSTCANANANATGCVPWVNNAYTWTDNFTTLKKMMVWRPGQPDYYLNADFCVQMAIVNKTDGTGGSVSGQLNDFPCTSTTATDMINYIRGYVCGKKAYPIYS